MASKARILTVILAALALISVAGHASADPAVRIAGFVDIAPAGPGGTPLALPLAHGAAPVTIQIQLGVPAVSVPVQITATTQIESDSGLPVTLTDGDRVKIDAVTGSGVIRAIRLELEEFPEIEARGTASGLPAAGVSLPLAAGTTVSFKMTLVAGVDVPLVLTDKTKTRKPKTLDNGDTIKVEAVVRNSKNVVTEIAIQGN